MKTRFILFRRAGVFYSEDTATHKQISLRTKNKNEAVTLLNAKNESFRQPALNLQMARVYLVASDPGVAPADVAGRHESNANARQRVHKDSLCAGSNPKDALLVTLNACGRVDLGFISTLLHQSSSEFLPELKGAIFLNPQTNNWETEDAYLSGNVRSKLAAAEATSIVEKNFEENVAALKTVQPVDLSPSEIDARLGSTWVPVEDVQNFAENLLRENGIRVAHVPRLS